MRYNRPSAPVKSRSRKITVKPMSEAAQAGRLDGEWERDRVQADGRLAHEKESKMEQTIETTKETFGCIRVTIPMRVKESMLDWCRQSGLGKAEFFRVSLMLGVMLLADQINAKNPLEGYKKNE